MKFQVREFVDLSSDSSLLQLDYRVIDGPFRGFRFSTTESLRDKAQKAFLADLLDKLQKKYDIIIDRSYWDVEFVPAKRAMKRSKVKLTDEESAAPTVDSPQDGAAA